MHEKNRRVWSDEDKRMAVELSLRTSVASAARELGCSMGSIKKWTREQRLAETGIPRLPGRPAAYETVVEPNLAAIAGMSRRGATKKEIAEVLGISTPTLRVWENKYNVLANALKQTRELADAEVENALYRQAIGYRYRTQQVTTKGEIVEVELYQAPNTTAQIFWLKNRKPELWRDKQEITHDVGEDLAKLIQESMGVSPQALPEGDVVDIEAIDVDEDSTDSGSGRYHPVDPG